MGGGKKGRKGGSSSLSQAAAKGKIDADLKDDANENKNNEKRKRESNGTPPRNKIICIKPPDGTMDVSPKAITPGKNEGEDELTSKQLFNSLSTEPIIDVASKFNKEIQYDYWEEPEMKPKDKNVTDDFEHREIFAKAKSYETFDEGNPNSKKIMKLVFDKLLSPVWKYWSGKPSDDYKGKMNVRADYLRFTLHIIKFKNPNMNEEINKAQICLASLARTSPEKFQPYWTPNPPQIKDCQLAEIWLAANRCLGSKWKIEYKHLIPERPIKPPPKISKKKKKNVQLPPTKKERREIKVNL